MVHQLVVGQTTSGKTTLAAKLLREISLKTNREVVVLDPNKDSIWETDHVFTDKSLFLDYVFNHAVECEVVVDEGATTIGRRAKSGDILDLATRGRHWGHRCTFIAQRAQDVDKSVRAQCTTLICFSQYASDSKTLAEEFVDEELKNAHMLGRGEYYLKRRFKEVLKLNAFES